MQSTRSASAVLYVLGITFFSVILRGNTGICAKTRAKLSVNPTMHKSHGRLSARASLKPRELMQEHPPLAHLWTAKVITLFPELFPGALGASLLGKALDEQLWQLETINLRQFGLGKHKNVDDTPAGGGAGMVLRPDVIANAFDYAAQNIPTNCQKWPLIYLSPRGKPLTQAYAKTLSEGAGVTLLCGRFEGVDQRVLDAYNVQEISIGDYILTGGELGAQVLIDATVRLIPRVLGNAESVQEESFSNGLLEHPHYSGSRDWQGHMIPEVLHSGHHGKIAQWRHQQSQKLTKKRRPDLWRAHNANPIEGQSNEEEKPIPHKSGRKETL